MSFFEFLDQAGGFYYEVNSLFPAPRLLVVVCKRVKTH